MLSTKYDVTTTLSIGVGKRDGVLYVSTPAKAYKILRARGLDRQAAKQQVHYALTGRLF